VASNISIGGGGGEQSHNIQTQPLETHTSDAALNSNLQYNRHPAPARVNPGQIQNPNTAELADIPDTAEEAVAEIVIEPEKAYDPSSEDEERDNHSPAEEAVRVVINSVRYTQSLQKGVGPDCHIEDV
jgi:hypothetical protein